MAVIEPRAKPLIHEHQVIIFSWVLRICSCSVCWFPMTRTDGSGGFSQLHLGLEFGQPRLRRSAAPGADGREMDQRRPGAGGASPVSPDELGSWLIRFVVETCCRSFLNELMVCSEDDMSIYLACQLLISYYSWHVMVTSIESLINLALAVLK